MISAAPASPEWGLLSAPRSLLVQSDANPKKLQEDGWGVGWYRNARPQWVKSEKPYLSEEKRVWQVASACSTRIALAHIRKASNPLGLPQGDLIRAENTQPFAFRHYLFAHNGTLNIPNEVRDSLGSWSRRVQGVNDSEVLFWLLMSKLDEGLAFPAAYAAMVRYLMDLWKGLGREGEPYTGLNVLFSDGSAVYGACHALQVPMPYVSSLCTKDWPYWRMTWRSEATQAWIASEPLDAEEGWHLLTPGRYVCARTVAGQVRVKTGRLAVPATRRVRATSA